jgi:tRNA nucleotidyltransferase/poly(A) polymerase
LINSPLISSSDILDRTRQAIGSVPEVYLVGGAVRDALLGKNSHDLDFVMGIDPRPVARRVANAIGGAYFVMDELRQTARVVMQGGQWGSMTLDFARFRRSDLADDLIGRDFTVNAMAVPLGDLGKLIDPLGGADDLRKKVLRQCSPTAFGDDPLRILRSVRLALAYELRILPETLTSMKLAVPQIGRISAERRRDELFRILEGIHPAAAIRSLDLLGALPEILPELEALKGVEQSPPHVSDVWEHTLNTVDRLEQVLSVLKTQYLAEKGANLLIGMVVLELGRYRESISQSMSDYLTPQRSLRGLLVLAALYHDISKPATWKRDDTGRIRNFGHEEHGAGVVFQAGKRLQLSNDETNRLVTVVRNHMRIHHLTKTGQLPTRKAVYRFFRDTGSAGVDVCMLALADILATYGPTMDVDTWQRQLQVTRVLLECWFEKPEESIHPPVLLNGHDLQNELKLKPGHVMGQLLAIVHEAQAAGEIHNREEALEFARHWMRKKGNTPDGEDSQD